VKDAQMREIEQAALRLLASREHTRAELYRKLRSRAADEGLLERVLDALEAQRALSDQRFVETYIASRRRKGFGPVRIRMELREKGVANSLTSDWLDENDPEWDEVLKQTAQRKFGPTPPADLRELSKRTRFLEYRGFSPERIRLLLQDNG
jgi:regulatory protein